jgi:hypothetical protein
LREAGNGWVEEVGGRKQSLKTAGVEREEISRDRYREREGCIIIIRMTTII